MLINIKLLSIILTVCAILTVCTCMCNLLICKPVWSPADPAISCLSVDVIILFVHMLIAYCLFTVSGISLLLGTIFMACPCVTLISMLLCLFVYVPSLFLLLVLLANTSALVFYTLVYMEGDQELLVT